MKILNLDEAKLNSTEYAIVKEINENPDYFCSHSIQEVSKASNVSPSTMTRVCQKLGFTSFKSAQMFVYEKSRMQSDYYKLGDDKTPEQIIHNVKGSAMYTVNETLSNLDPCTMEKIAKAIYSSNRVLIFGLEQQQTSANAFVLNLGRINITANAVANIHTFTQRAVFFDEKDFVVFITRTGWTKEVVESIKWTSRRKIPSLVLSTDVETTKKYVGDAWDESSSYMLETQLINADKVKYPTISSLPGELLIFDVIFNIIVGLNQEFREKFEKTAEISLKWNFEGSF